MAEASIRLIDELAITGELLGAPPMSDRARRVYAAELASYPEEQVINALCRCRRELRNFPTLSDVLSRIDDGRPGAEEAWAMLPKSEADSVVWTGEMAGAFGTVSEMIGVDSIAARMAFREVYVRMVTEARANRRTTHWVPSLGHNKAGHEPVLRDAVAKNRLTISQATALIPDLRPATCAAQLAGPGEPELNVFDPMQIIQHIKENIAKAEEP